MIKPIRVLLHVKFDDPSNYSAKYHAYAISRTDYSKCHYIRYVWLHLPVFVYTGLINKSLLTSEASSAERSLRKLAKVWLQVPQLLGTPGSRSVEHVWMVVYVPFKNNPTARLNLFIAFTELIREINPLPQQGRFTQGIVYIAL